MNEEKYIKIIEKVMPAVVSITLLEKIENLKKDLKIKKDKKYFLKDDEIEIGGGSGFFVDKEGLILTNKHILAPYQNVNYKITTEAGKNFEAEIVSRDPLNDIAILKIKNLNNEKFPFLKMGDSSKLKLGQFVLAFGNVLGIFRNTVSSGIISGLSRAVKARPDPKEPIQELRGLIQTDAAINPGNSGGPLVNMKGEVIGINVAVVAGAQNIGFAIPINAAKRDVEDIRKFGAIRRPYIGIRFISITDEIAKEMSLPYNFGILITKEHPNDEAVIKNSPAYKAGIKENDILLYWNNIPLQGEIIRDLLENSNVGEKIKIKFLRGEKILETELILEEKK
jgi:serine protease Do